MAVYTIKDLEKLSGILAHTIRIWEKRYGIIKPSRTDTNRRRYTDNDLRKILNISVLNRNGIKISRIAAMTDRDVEEMVKSISFTSEHNESIIKSLVIAMIELDEEQINERLDMLIDTRGFEAVFTDIVFPFLHRAGTLWATGTVNPSQEHFITAILRQKLISETDKLPDAYKPSARRVLLFLPEHELHELGLLFYSFLARKHGHRTLYLGQLTPFDSLEHAVGIWKPDIILTGTHSLFSDIEPEDYVQKLSESFPGQKILITGLLSEAMTSGIFPNLVKINTPDQFIRTLSGEE